jgi:hypothetical protein
MLKETEQARGTHTLSYAEEEHVRIPNNTKQARDTHSLSSPGKGKVKTPKGVKQVMVLMALTDC